MVASQKNYKRPSEESDAPDRTIGGTEEDVRSQLSVIKTSATSEINSFGISPSD
jgi:hypothetical protein